MKEKVLAIVQNERLVDMTHWTVFGLGALSLATSLLFTAMRVMGL